MDHQIENVASIVHQACADVGHDPARLLDILLKLQKELRCICTEVMEQVASELGSYRVVIEGMVSYYAFLSDTPKGRVTIRICDDIVDRYAGLPEIVETLTQELGIAVGETSEDGNFSLEYTPCIGMCDQVPAILVNEVVISRLTPKRVRKICRKLKDHLDPARLVSKPGDGNNAHPLINAMVENNIRHPGEVLLGPVPENAGLKEALKHSPREVIEMVKQSRLRGRGGAGFPTGRKLEIAADTEADQRYLLCNADEGEPGTFKDRVLLTERTDLLIEGMTISAYAFGADQAIIYLRGEYEYLQPWLEHCLEQRRRQGWLGKEIGGVEGFNLEIRIQLGAGAYMCGEESAMISSCEGQRGEPRNRPPFPAQRGYLGCPTVVDNVETLCDLPRIIEKGPEWFASFGTEQSTGTKLISISGDCKRPGVYEVPFGIKISKLLKMSGADDAAAILVGGPSGEMISQRDIGRTISFEDMPTGGALVVFNTKRNILEIVDYYMAFFVDESCGYCTPCRVGNVFMKKRLEKVKNGLAEPADLDYLKELGNTIINTSRCGLGQTSPKPVLTTINNFPLVYAALLKEPKTGQHASFDIQAALEESRHIARRRSMIYDPTYSEE